MLIEYDRTARAHKQISKWRRYEDFLTAGWRTSRYADLALDPLVLFICDDARRLPSFLASADEHLVARAPMVAEVDGDEHPGREQIAFTSRDRLVRGDWQLLQLSSRPTTQPSRWNQSSTMIRPVDLELPQLFVAPMALP